MEVLGECYPRHRVREFPRFRAHEAPTCRSWLILIERWFAVLSERKIKRASHRGTLELERDIRGFLRHTNQRPKPFVWTRSADQIVANDLRRVQHPLVVLLLLTAGALWSPSLLALWLLAPYLLFRIAGKTAGAWAVARLVDVRAGDLAAFLMPPGVLAVAFALNFRQVLPSASGEILVSTVAMGTAAFELFALAVVPHWRRRRH